MSNWTMFGGSRAETFAAANRGVLLDNGGIFAHALGPWTSLGTTTFEWSSIACGFAFSTGLASFVDIGIGSSGAQQIVVENFFLQAEGVVQHAAFSVPVKIPAGVEVWSRMRSATNSGAAYISVTGMAGEAVCPFPSGVRLVQCLNANTGATAPSGVMTQSGNSSNESSWAEIVSSTANRYVALWGVLHNGGDTSRSLANFVVDIAIGGSGSEVILIENIGAQQEGRIMNSAVFGPFLVDVPAGTRVASRVRCDNSAADSLAIAVMGAVP